ncbi:soma ferritin [Anthonomus grandis grandis]|uniref:soma ferritin n=1 Tax=Anthonomus grandis grandis TaxID=2921223 RepID=UPI0021657DA3|nr:soma ferritin [Anthonomus grandis grandis]
MAHSQIRQNFHKDCEDAINKQINMELFASYTYLSMAYHFNRDDVALKGHFKYFKDASEEEREHAQKLMEYMNKRGGRIVLTPIEAPVKQEWVSAQEAMHSALELEKAVNESLLNLHSTASGHMDVNLCDFLETHFLQEQVDAIKEIADHVTNLKRVGDGLGVFMFDQKLHD